MPETFRIKRSPCVHRAFTLRSGLRSVRVPRSLIVQRSHIVHQLAFSVQTSFTLRSLSVRSSFTHRSLIVRSLFKWESRTFQGLYLYTCIHIIVANQVHGVDTYIYIDVVVWYFLNVNKAFEYWQYRHVVCL